MPEDAFNQLIDNKNHKFALESDYPYAGHDQDCQFDSPKSVAYVSAVKMYTKETEIQENILKCGPTSVLIDATAFVFMLYKIAHFSKIIQLLLLDMEKKTKKLFGLSETLLEPLGEKMYI